MLTITFACEKMEKMWIWQLGLGLWRTSRLGLRQIQSFVFLIKDVSCDLPLFKNEFKLKLTLTLTQNANPNLCVRKNEENVILTVRVMMNFTVRVRAN